MKTMGQLAKKRLLLAGFLVIMLSGVVFWWYLGQAGEKTPERAMAVFAAGSQGLIRMGEGEQDG